MAAASSSSCCSSLVRGLPQFLLYRHALPDIRERWQFTLYVATGLPILVAITALQVGNGLMRPENAAALVGAGALSVLVFPLLGDRLNRGSPVALTNPQRTRRSARASAGSLGAQGI